MKRSSKAVVGFVAVFFIGYAVGVGWAKREADQYWTDGAVRNYITLNHTANASPRAMLSIKCKNDVYVYDSERSVVEPRGANHTQDDELPKLTTAEAIAVSGFLGVPGLPELQKAPWSKNTLLVAVASIFGFALGYHSYAEEVPDCKRESMQLAFKDLAFWQRLANARVTLTPFRRIPRQVK